MIVTTTSVVEGRTGAEYLGVVSGRAIHSDLGESYDWRTSFKGGRRGGLEEVLAEAEYGGALRGGSERIRDRGGSSLFRIALQWGF